MILTYTDNPACDDGDIRLTGRVTSTGGRLEICHLGTWGTVCDDTWTSYSTMVACRQLGLMPQGKERKIHLVCSFLFIYLSIYLFLTGGSFQSMFIEDNTGPILLDNLKCSGNEDNLISCNSSSLNDHACKHIEDIYLFCPPACMSDTVHSNIIKLNAMCGL